MFRHILTFSALLVLTAFAGVRETPAVNAVRKALPCVVSIGSESTVATGDPYIMRLHDFFAQFLHHPRQTQEYTPLGSGIVIDKSGLILTNWHVVRAAEGRLQINLKNDVRCMVDLIGFDINSDLCLIRARNSGEVSFEAASFAKAGDLLLGETVLALGNPYGLEHSVSQGLLSALNRSLGGKTEYSDMIQTDAAINPGNSGGPLINLEGDVIGINQAMRGNAQGIGFAIPVKRIEAFLAQWLTPETFSDATAGFSVTSTENGIEVDSAADDCPLKKGDIIRKMQGKNISSLLDFIMLSWQFREGTEIKITLSDGRNVTVTVRKMDDTEIIVRRLGMSMQKLTPALCNALNIPENTKGLVITGVYPEKEYRGNDAKWRSSLRRGDILLAINGTQTDSIGKLADKLRKKNSGSMITADFAAMGRNHRYLRFQTKIILK